MTFAGQKKLGRLVERLVRDERSGLSDQGQAFLTELLKWRLGLVVSKPSLPRGLSLQRRRYEQQIIEQRAARALAQLGVADEVEAAGGTIR